MFIQKKEKERLMSQVVEIKARLMEKKYVTITSTSSREAFMRDDIPTISIDEEVDP